MGPHIFCKPDEALQTILLSNHLDRQPENRLSYFNKLETCYGRGKFDLALF